MVGDTTLMLKLSTIVCGVSGADALEDERRRVVDEHNAAGIGMVFEAKAPTADGSARSRVT